MAGERPVDAKLVLGPGHMGLMRCGYVDALVKCPACFRRAYLLLRRIEDVDVRCACAFVFAVRVRPPS